MNQKWRSWWSTVQFHQFYDKLSKKCNNSQKDFLPFSFSASWFPLQSFCSGLDGVARFIVSDSSEMACKEHSVAIFYYRRDWQSLKAPKTLYWETKDWQTCHSLDRSPPLLPEPSNTRWAGKGWCSAMSSCFWDLHWRLWNQWQPGRNNYTVCSMNNMTESIRFFFCCLTCWKDFYLAACLPLINHSVRASLKYA